MNVIPSDQLSAIREQAGLPDLNRLFQACRPQTVSDPDNQALICGALCFAAFSAPAATNAVFDTISASQLQRPKPKTNNITDLPSISIPASFWELFQQTLVGPEGGYNATSITLAVAGLGAGLSPDFGKLCEQVALAHPGAADAADKATPMRLSLSELHQSPEGSLAKRLADVLTDNQFDPEVLDRDQIGLKDLPPALRYLNTRILQMHDVWHLVAGYQTTSLHEMGISAFQLAQFGHQYSGMFLATVTTLSHVKSPAGFALLLKNLSEAWQHGRQSPAFMAIEWEDVWHEPLASIRAQFNIESFKGSYPPNLLELLAPQT